jgi:hypothetical protein
MLKFYIQLIGVVVGFILFMTHFSVAQIRMDSILLHYDFNGNLKDRSGNDFHAIGVYDFKDGFNGVRNQSISFQTGSPPIKLPTSLVYQRDSFQIHALFRSAIPGALIGIQHYGYPNRNYHYVSPIYITKDGMLTGQMWNGSRYGQPVSESIVLNKWNRIIFEKIPNRQRLYLNGQLIGEQVGSISDLDMTLWQLGTAYLEDWPGTPDNTLWFPFEGLVDDFQVRVPIKRSAGEGYSQDCPEALIPNPAEYSTELFSSQKVFDLKAWNSSGELISSHFQYSDNKIYWDYLPSGHYFLQVHTDSGNVCLMDLVIIN